MEKESYRLRTVSFEGGDQVGKGDAVLNISEYLFEKGENVSVISFPLYALPFGMSIRKMLCSSQEDWENIEGMKEVVGTKRQSEIAMEMFALNRLETLDYLLKVAKKGDILLFDRSSFSNALTLAYHVYLGNIKEEEIEEEIDKALHYDNLFIDQLCLKNCVLNLRTKNTSWGATRGEGEDKYERKEVQELCDAIYDSNQKKVGKGWKQIITRIDGEWRSREDIRNDCLSFISQRINLERKTKGSLSFIDLKPVVASMYPGITVPNDLYKTWLKSTKINDKKGIYESSIRIGEHISNNLIKIEMSDAVKGKFKEVLSEYPEIYALLDEFAGKKFREILVKTLNG
jgi:thymidylate kinase